MEVNLRFLFLVKVCRDPNLRSFRLHHLMNGQISESFIGFLRVFAVKVKSLRLLKNEESNRCFTIFGIVRVRRLNLELGQVFPDFPHLLVLRI